MIAIPISTSSLDASIIIFDATNTNMNKLSDFGCNNNNTTIAMSSILLFLSFFAVVAIDDEVIIIIDVIDCGGPATIIECECIIIIYDEFPDLNDTRRDIKSYIIILVTINSLDLIKATIMDICTRMKNICDGYGTFDGMISVLNILNRSSTSMLISHAITIVFDEMGLQTNKLSEFECTCCNIMSTSINGNNLKFNTSSDTSIVVTHCLPDINLNMQLINGSASNITILIQFDANNVAMDELVLNSAVYLSIDAVSLSYVNDSNVWCISVFIF